MYAKRTDIKNIIQCSLRWTDVFCFLVFLFIELSWYNFLVSTFSDFVWVWTWVGRCVFAVFLVWHCFLALAEALTICLLTVPCPALTLLMIITKQKATIMSEWRKEISASFVQPLKNIKEDFLPHPRVFQEQLDGIFVNKNKISTRLCMSVFPSVRLSVCMSARPDDKPQGTSWWSCPAQGSSLIIWWPDMRILKSHL